MATAAGLLRTVAGTGTNAADGDPSTWSGAAAQAVIGYIITSIVAAPDGSILFADNYNGTILRVTPDGRISIAAGIPHISLPLVADTGDGGMATQAVISAPRYLAFDAKGNLLIAEDYGTIRQIAPAGFISTVGGRSGSYTVSGPTPPIVDGQSSAATSLNNAGGLAVDSAGTIYIGIYSLPTPVAVRGVYRITTQGQIFRVPGPAGLNVSMDSAGNIYSGTASTLRTDTSGNTSVFAGGGGGVAGRRRSRIGGGAEPFGLHA